MPTNETVIEIVRFTEKGIPEVAARTKAFAAQVDETAKKQKVLLGLLADPRWAKNESRVEGMRKQYELMSLRARNLAAAQGLADGSTARHIQSVQRLNAEYQKTQRVTEYVARYGERTGRFLARFGGALSAVGGGLALGATAVAGAGIGLAHQGFQGTVEQARFQSELNQLAREFAGIMKPVMELMTKGARSIRKQLEKLDESGQNVVMGGMILGGTAGGALALRGAARFMGMGLGGAAGGAASAGAGAVTSAAGGAAGGAAAAGASRGAMLARGGAVAGIGLSMYDQGRDIATDRSTTRAVGRSAVRGMDMIFGGEAFRAMGYKSGGPLGQIYDATFGRNTARDDPPPGAAKRRQVQLAGGGFESMDDTYERLTSAIEKVEGERDTTELTAAIRLLADEVRRMGGPDMPRPGGA